MNNVVLTICFKNSFETISWTIALLGFQIVWSNPAAIVWFWFFTKLSIDKFPLSLFGLMTLKIVLYPRAVTGLCSFGHKSGPRRGEKNESWALARTHARPARAHSTCYSMAGSTWSKNTNFHAFMASKKSLNFQIIFNITCLYWAARSSQRVSSKCQIGIGKPIGTDTVHWIDSWERLRDSCLMSTRDHEMKIR